MNLKPTLVSIALALVGCAGVYRDNPLPQPRPEQTASPEPWAVRSFQLPQRLFWLGGEHAGRTLDALGKFGPTILRWVNGEWAKADLSLVTSLSVGNHLLAPADVHDYESRLDFRRALLTQRFTYLNSAISVSTFADDVLAQKITVSSPTQPFTLTLRPRQDRSEALRITRGKFAYVSSANYQFFSGAEPATAVRMNQHTVIQIPETAMARIQLKEIEGQGVQLTIVPGREPLTLSCWATVRAASSSLSLPPSSFDFDQHQKKWNQIWATDIELEGPVEDQQFVRSALFYLRMSTPDVCPPMSTSSDVYNGHRFWDAEAWMLPVYAFIDRSAAAKMTRWRLDHTRNGTIPWEAGPNGEDRTDQHFERALHQNGWVSWWLDRARVLGLVNVKAAEKLQLQIAKKFESRATTSGNLIEFRDVESPDEGLQRDNDLTTNLLADRSLRQFPNRFREALRTDKLKIKIPRAEDGLPATYDRDPLRRYQQTSALLSIFPLEAITDRAVTEKMFDRYKDKTDPYGPAMSDSIHATIAARIGRPQEAYELWSKSWRDFVRPDGMLFSERRGKDVEYFSTGAAGCLETVLYGFLGLRIEKGGGPSDEPAKSLNDGYRLYVRPNLPPAWKSLTFKGIQLPDGTYNIHATHSGVSITRGG